MSTLAGLSPTFSHRGRAPTRCTPNRGGRQILHHCSGGCGAAALAQVAGFRSSRGPPCVGGHGRQYRQYRQFRQYRQRQWAGRRRLGTRPTTGYVPVAVGRSASNWRFCASSRGGSTSPWAFRRGRRGSDGRSRSRHRRRGLEGLVVVAGPLALTLSRWRPLRDPLVAEGAGGHKGRPYGGGGIDSRAREGRVWAGFAEASSGSGARPPPATRPRRAWERVPSLSLSQRERGLGVPSPTVAFAYPRCGGSGRPQGPPLRGGIDSLSSLTKCNTRLGCCHGIPTALD